MDDQFPAPWRDRRAPGAALPGARLQGPARSPEPSHRAARRAGRALARADALAGAARVARQRGHRGVRAPHLQSHRDLLARAGPADDERVRALVSAVLDESGGRAGARHGRRSADAPPPTHLFRVCCGLESLALGEAEILGQARAALDAIAQPARSCAAWCVSALRTGDMARAETADRRRRALGRVGGGAAASRAALPLDRSRVLVVGAGATGVKVARHLRALGVEPPRPRQPHAGARRDGRRRRWRADVVGLDAARRRADAGRRGLLCAVAPRRTAHLGRRPRTRRGGGATAVRCVVVDLSMPPAVEPGDGVRA